MVGQISEILLIYSEDWRIAKKRGKINGNMENIVDNIQATNTKPQLDEGNGAILR